MARFQGRPAERPDRLVSVVVGALIIVLLLLFVWFIVDRAAFMLYWENLNSAMLRR